MTRTKAFENMWENKKMLVPGIFLIFPLFSNLSKNLLSADTLNLEEFKIH